MYIYSNAGLAYKVPGGPDETVNVDGDVDLIFIKFLAIFLEVHADILFLLFKTGKAATNKHVKTFTTWLRQSWHFTNIIEHFFGTYYNDIINCHLDVCQLVHQQTLEYNHLEAITFDTTIQIHRAVVIYMNLFSIWHWIEQRQYVPLEWKPACCY